SSLVVEDNLWLYGCSSLSTIPRNPGSAIDNNSITSSENGRIPPIENSKRSFSGNFSRVRRVKSRCPNQCFKNSSFVKIAVVSILLNNLKSIINRLLTQL